MYYSVSVSALPMSSPHQVLLALGYHPESSPSPQLLSLTPWGLA